jgi:hypothetical protein
MCTYSESWRQAGSIGRSVSNDSPVSFGDYRASSAAEVAEWIDVLSRMGRDGDAGRAWKSRM